MAPEEPTRTALNTDTEKRLETLCADHGVELAVVFGSSARRADAAGDLDLAVAFADHRPTDPGYASVFLDLRAALASALDPEIDLVDIRSMPPRFASVVFEDGVVVYGSEDRLRTLADRLAGDPPSVAEASARVSAAATRLTEESP